MAYGKLKVDIIESSTEALTLPTAGGTNGQVLTTDGNGALSFEDNATKTDLTATGNGTSLTVESSSGNNVALPAATTSAWGVMTDEDKTKLDAIETSATADQTGAEIKAAYEGESDTNAFTDADHTKLDGIETSADVTDTANVVAALTAGTNVAIAVDGTISSTDTTYSVGDGGLSQVNFTTADNTKLDGIETSATADQTGAEIKTAYEGESDTNAFTDADHSKLDGIEASATADQTNAEIRAAVEAATDSNVFTDSDHTKLDAIETSATADQTGAEIKAAYEGESDTNAFTDADHTKLDAIEASADVTDTANVVAALTAGNNVSIGTGGTISSTDTTYTAGTNVSISSVGVISSTDTTYSVGDGGLSQVSFTTADNTKLDGIETSATADQTAAEIRTAVGSATDSNVFTDADHTKLDGISASANNYSISSDLLDEDDFTTNSATKPASQQSIKAYVDSEVTALIGGAPGALDTLNELAASIGDDSDYAATMTTALGLKAPAASPTFTGTVAIPNITDLESAVTSNTAKVTNVTTDLAVSRSGSAFTVTSSDGTNASLPLADTDSWGLMSDEQFDKLAAIESSATADQTGAEIKTAYEAESDTNAFTDADHTKLDGIASSANNYSHPSYNGDDFSVDTGPLTGATVVSDIDVNVTTDSSGHVTDANGSVSTRTLTLSDLGYSGATNANNYSHPSYNGDDFSVDTGALSGATVVSDIDINVTTDGSGHVTDANGSVSTRTLTLSDLGYSGASNANYITNNNQLSNGSGYVTSSGNTVIGTDSDIDTSGATIIDNLYMTDGVITSHGTRTLTLGDLGYSGATNANNYSHPSYNGDDFSIDTGHLSGATVIDDIDINVTTDSSGHVTDCNGTVATRSLTLGDLGYTGATNANYITNNNQLSNGSGYVTSSGNTVIGTDSDINTSGSGIIDNLYMTDGVITSHGTRSLTLADLGYTGATNANNYSISSDLLDEDNFASNSATKAPSQQSVKAYVAANAGVDFSSLSSLP